MRTHAAPPFLEASASAIEAADWCHLDGTPLPERLEHWDPGTTLRIARHVRIDMDAVRADTLIGPSAKLALTTTWVAAATRLSGSGPPMELGSVRGVIEGDVEVAIPGDTAGGALTIETCLILRSPDPFAPSIAATRPGSILWGDSFRTALEGGSARFPMTTASFSQSLHHPDGAAWVLDWDPAALDAPVLGALLLLVNEDRRDILEAIGAAGRAPTGPIPSFIMLDVARALTHAALHNDEFLEHPDGWEPDSVGRLIRDLLETVWPGVPVTALRDRLASNPSRVDSELQGHFPIASA